MVIDVKVCSQLLIDTHSITCSEVLFQHDIIIQKHENVGITSRLQLCYYILLPLDAHVQRLLYLFCVSVCACLRFKSWSQSLIR